jgi:hypothetical protein
MRIPFVESYTDGDVLLTIVPALISTVEMGMEQEYVDKFVKMVVADD